METDLVTTTLIDHLIDTIAAAASLRRQLQTAGKDPYRSPVYVELRNTATGLLLQILKSA